jgi:hypothetical protein
LVGSQEKQTLYLTVTVQLVVAVIGAVAAVIVNGKLAGISVFWGGVAAAMNLALLAWRMVSGDRPTLNAEQHLWLMYRSSVERFFVVATLLALGLWRFKLIPFAVLLGFLVGQVVLVVIPIMRGMLIKNGKS